MSRIEVDLNKKSDAEWQQAFDRLGLAGAPMWFEWLNWTLIIGALQYLHRRTHSIAIGIVLGISAALFLYYFAAFFHRYTFRNIPHVHSERASRVASFCLSSLLGLGSWILLTSVIDILAAREAPP